MNCKPGDMAYITDEPNKGAVVEVLRMYDSNRELWEVRPGWPMKGWDEMTGESQLWTLECGLGAVAYDCDLRPIRGLPESESTSNEKKEKVPCV